MQAVGGALDSELPSDLAALMAPTQPELAEAYANTPLAPRVAALCMLHRWVQDGGEGAGGRICFGGGGEARQRGGQGM
jgi:hypothetical protein